MKRFSVHKGKSARSFRRKTTQTKRINTAGAVMRGGIRL